MAIKKIKGKISYIRLGAFNKESKNGKKIVFSESFKKDISSSKFTINTNEKKIADINKIFVVNFFKI